MAETSLCLSILVNTRGGLSSPIEPSQKYHLQVKCTSRTSDNKAALSFRRWEQQFAEEASWAHRMSSQQLYLHCLASCFTLLTQVQPDMRLTCSRGTNQGSSSRRASCNGRRRSNSRHQLAFLLLKKLLQCQWLQSKLGMSGADATPPWLALPLMAGMQVLSWCPCRIQQSTSKCTCILKMCSLGTPAPSRWAAIRSGGSPGSSSNQRHHRTSTCQPSSSIRPVHSPRSSSAQLLCGLLTVAAAAAAAVRAGRVHQQHAAEGTPAVCGCGGRLR